LRMDGIFHRILVYGVILNPECIWGMKNLKKEILRRLHSSGWRRVEKRLFNVV
jgi:hypothetical protein